MDGETTKTVTVSVAGDSQAEANETFYLKLTSPVGAGMADGSGLGRITNDDGRAGGPDVLRPSVVPA